MPELKKVVHVMRRFVPEKWGGTESVVFNLSNELRIKGIESPVFCTSMLSNPGTESMKGVRIRRFKYLLPWLGLSKEDKRKMELKGGSPLSLPLFFALLKEKKISLIHTHVQHRLGGMARTVARLKKIPYVVSLHGGYFTLPQDQIEKMTEPFRGKPEWGKIFGALFGSRRVLDDADAIICVGQSEFDEVKKHFPGKPVFLVPNGVDADRFSNAGGAVFRKAFGFGASDKIVLCVSRIDHQKNQLGLVRAFAEFSGTHPDHRLVLIGAVTVEAYLDEINFEIQRLGIGDKIRVVEGLRPDDPLLAAAYKSAEMFVLPSMHEPFGMVALEAWAAGVPVIASRVGGIPGFAADRENILLVESGNEKKLAELMAELADDVALRTDLSLRAFGEVAHYGWGRIGDQYLKIYQEILAESLNNQ